MPIQYCNSCGVLNCYEVHIDRQRPLMAHYVLAYCFSFSGCSLNINFWVFLVCVVTVCKISVCIECIDATCVQRCSIHRSRICVRAVTHQAYCRPSASGGPLVSVCCSVFHTSALVSMLNRHLGRR